jgi:hypothetical protein
VQKLHLVGITPELDGLILSTRKGAKSGSFVVSVDASVLQQLNEGAKAKGRGSGGNGLRPREPRTSSPESQLAPREMQELLRAGWTIEEVADEAGVDADWVGRFASPVLAEMKRVLDAALAMVFDKPRVGPSAMALAPSVRRNVAERGLRFTDEDFEEMWHTHQLDDELWIVAFEYVSRGRDQIAEWVVDLDAGELSSHNRLGTQLGHVTTGRRRAAGAPPAKAATPKKKTTARPRSRQPAAKKSSKPSATAAKKKTPKPDPQDVYREELRRRLADPVTDAPARPPVMRVAPPPVVAPKPTPTPARAPERAPERPPQPPPAPRPAPAPPRREPEPVRKPVPIIGPTVRTLDRRPSRRKAPAPAPPPPAAEPVTGPTPAVHDELPDLSWSPPSTRGPMPAPDPLPVPEQVREKVATPIGADADDHLPAETWFPKTPTIKGAKQGATPTPPPADAAPKRRRAEPLRGR